MHHLGPAQHDMVHRSAPMPLWDRQERGLVSQRVTATCGRASEKGGEVANVVALGMAELSKGSELTRGTSVAAL